MKQFFTFCFIILPVFIFAQVSNTGKVTPGAPVSKSVITTVINPPASMPGSNPTPTTATVITLKKNKSTNSKGKNINNTDTVAPVKRTVKAKKKSR